MQNNADDLVMLTVLFASAFSAAAESNVYEVSTDVELSTALQNIADSADTKATIVLKADLNAPVTGGGAIQPPLALTASKLR